MPLLVADQRSEGWFKARQYRITASVAAGCLGLHPHMSRQEAWRRCLGIQKESENNATRWGVQFEEHAKTAYEVETGKLIEPTGFWVHPVHDFLGSSPDGFVDSDGVVEIKCPGKLPESVPIYHRIQMLVQMLCTERTWGHYYAWTPDGAFLKRVDIAGAAGLIRKLEAFYRTYVLTNTEPPRKKPKRRSKGAA
jgi:putative phage-type endonuclease